MPLSVCFFIIVNKKLFFGDKRCEGNALDSIFTLYRLNDWSVKERIDTLLYSNKNHCLLFSSVHLLVH